MEIAYLRNREDDVAVELCRMIHPAAKKTTHTPLAVRGSRP